MSEVFNLGDRLPQLVDRIVGSYNRDARMRHIDCAFLPSPAEVEELIRRSAELLFPGFFGRQDLSSFNVPFHVGELLPRIAHLAFRQVYKCLCYKEELAGKGAAGCEKTARKITLDFLDRMIAARDILSTDVQAAYDGDPAAINCDEIILAYPGLLAIAVHRLAHELYAREVPMLPRMMSEWAHRQTGIDIHPGARIGESFFIDHGTGVVIGETTEIGDHVKIYQGVTLGALSFPKDERGRIIRGSKRHPTVEDHVTIYANAIILGGDTVLRRGCTIGGSVFITSSVPEGATVNITPPALRVKDGQRNAPPTSIPARNADDFQI
ncbi:MAG TPA: serine acetyltransferase [Phycisphaerae bacterium]|nr:serine acetyltransferase [Phycisphaerae bacterium]